ncbi:glycosyltransferase family 2 protein [Saccharophagus degradans]|uniref:Glycosyltransferase family 2 protein n=1 Tax=Saccharophagus degradans TaxID=86304 RepID=A0AAW7XDL0_9GAMM|nr:glycosyltransferase family 2 protein [Saccharophagus degradans]MDO6424853.1 glycosyltransferase family 2 protein [Saccharophagus degradans]MDO6606641.1 glycosyltransferase family 2 protein [Saccharophagus degradans]
MTNKLISIVVPAYNEQEVITHFHERLAAVMNEMANYRWEVVYVNDGSKDDTLKILHGLRDADEHVAVLNLSRNFGKEIALTAGLDHSSGDAIVVIDADLQDPPELIPTLVERWEEGADVAYAKRKKRDGESAFKKATAHIFYRFMAKIGDVVLPEDTGDFRLLNRKALDALNSVRERHRFMKGLFAWIGFHQVAVEYDRDPRFAGVTKWNYWKLWNLALEGFTSFTTMPLKLATYIGVLTAFGSFVYGLYMIITTLINGNDVAGYPSLVVIVLFLGGIQLMSIGVIGEYLGRIFNETKKRPLYFTNEWVPSRENITISE